jgi:hypothetical protein
VELGHITDPGLCRTFGRLQQRARTAVLQTAQAEHWELAQGRLGDIGVLAAAIARHRMAVLGADFEPEPHDRELWATLAEVRVQCGSESYTLDEALGAGVWAKEVPDVD